MNPRHFLYPSIALIIILLTNCSGSNDAASPAPTSPPVVIPETEKPLTDSTAVEYFGALSVLGNQIVGRDQKPVQLRGMSFFWSQWIGKYYNQQVVNWLRTDWHCSVVRAAMAVEEGGYLTNPEAEKQKVFAVIDAAIAEGIYVIVDWHDHHATQHQQEAKKFFAEVAQKYGHTQNVIYETFNEPLQFSWSSVIKPYHQAVIDTIRYWDSDNLIVCGTPTWSQDVDVAATDPLNGQNIAYSLHFYAGTHKQYLRDKATLALSKGIALFVTEYGTTDATGDGAVDQSETMTWLDFADKNKLSWCNWSVGDKAESSAALQPGSSIIGQWPTSSLTASGIIVRSQIRSKNLRFK